MNTKENSVAATRYKPTILIRIDNPARRPAMASQRARCVSRKRNRAAMLAVARKRLYQDGIAAG